MLTNATFFIIVSEKISYNSSTLVDLQKIPSTDQKQRKEETGINLNLITVQAESCEIHVTHLGILQISQQCRVAQP